MREKWRGKPSIRQMYCVHTFKGTHVFRRTRSLRTSIALHQCHAEGVQTAEVWSGPHTLAQPKAGAEQVTV
jgi:hypothetical protein